MTLEAQYKQFVQQALINVYYFVDKFIKKYLQNPTISTANTNFPAFISVSRENQPRINNNDLELSITG